MFERVAALVAALIIGLLPVAWVSTAVGLSYDDYDASSPLAAPGGNGFEMAVLGSTSREHDLTDMPPVAKPDPTARPTASARRSARPDRERPAEAPAWPEIAGIGSNYPGTAGYIGQATVALPGAMGGRYTGAVQGHVTVCADRCVRLPVVDWCQCYWGSADQRVVDISHAAWPLISDRPLSAGLIEVRVILDDPNLAAAWGG